MTIRDICTSAAQEINVLAAGETLEDDDADVIFERLNDLLDEWKALAQMIFQVKRETFATVAGTPSYLIGPGAAWSIASRPELANIAGAGWVATDVNPTDPLETPMDPFTVVQWNRVSQKTLQNNICTRYWYETSFLTPGYGRFFPYPVPSVAAQVALYLAEPLGEAATLDDTVLMPPAYRKTLKTNLAIDICDVFEKTPSPILLRKASNARRAVTGANAKPGILRMPARLMRGPGRGGGYNILTNE